MSDSVSKKSYEVEVRFSIDDIDTFKKIVSDLGCQLVKEYSFTDYYYKPVLGHWNSLEKTIRIRDWHQVKKPSVIYLTKQEIKTDGNFTFKKSLYLEGKTSLFSGNLDQCREILKDLGFKQVYAIDKKQGFVWKDSVHDLEFCAEETDVLGWIGEMEIEGVDSEYIKERIERHKKFLQLQDSQLSYKPMAVLLEEKLAE